MRLQELLDMFVNTAFLITVTGWCDKLSFSDYEDEKKKEYWDKYKDKKVVGLGLLTTYNRPELFIYLEN